MRRLMIAVCLLVLWPESVGACFDPVVSEWVTEKPRSYWEIPRESAGAIGLRELLGISMFLGSSAAGILVVLSLRALCRKAMTRRRHTYEPPGGVPLALPFDEPLREIIRVDEGHHEWEPAGIVLGEASDPGEIGAPVNFAPGPSCCPVGW